MGDVVPFRRPDPRPATRRPALTPDNPYWLADALHLRSYDRAIVHKTGVSPDVPADA